MSHKKAKAVRRALKGIFLPVSPLMISKETGNIRRGKGRRAVIQQIKSLPHTAQKQVLSAMQKAFPEGDAQCAATS